MSTDEAKVRLDIYGQAREITLEVRVGEATLLDLLAPARDLTRQVSDLAVLRAAAEEGKAVTCQRGCSACCHHLIPIAPVEARRLADVVASAPDDRRAELRRRFADAVARLEAAGLLDARAPKGRSALVAARTGDAKTLWLDVSRRYFDLHIPCPFLEDDACTAYPERPLTCREYQVTTPPERCATFDGAIDAIDRPVRMSEALTDAGHAVLGVQAVQVPLVLALEWAEARGRELDTHADGAELFFAMIDALSDEPAEAPANAKTTARRRAKPAKPKRRR